MELENSNDTTEHIEGALSYSFLIQTNITFLSSYPISGLFVQMPNDTSGRRNFHVGSGISYIFNNVSSTSLTEPVLLTYFFGVIRRPFPLRDQFLHSKKKSYRLRERSDYVNMTFKGQ